MLLIDDLLFGGLSFVLDKLATVVDQELNDESRLHQTLMEAQMRFELGEIDADEFAGIERTVIDRLREIRAERDAGAPALTDEGVRISSIEISGPDADVDVDVDMPVVDIESAAAATSAGRGAEAAAKAMRAAGSARHAKSGLARAKNARPARHRNTKAARPDGRRGARR